MLHLDAEERGIFLDKLQQKMQMYIELYGVDGLNLVIKRHELAGQKRTWFSIRFASQDEEQEANCTKEMDKLSHEIDLLDKELERIGITQKNRPSITKDVKKYCPDGWFTGFGKGL